MELKEIPGFNGHYGITVDGRVWDYRRNQFLTSPINPYGYYVVSLGKDRVWKDYFIHRLILAAWGGLDLNDKQMIVHHIDRNKVNNHIKNLQIMTKSKHSTSHNHVRAKGYSINTKTHKICTKCEKLKLRSEFVAHSRKLDGLSDHCKSCQKEYSQAYYQQNCDRVKEYVKIYRQQNRDRVKEYGKIYRQQNRDKAKTYYQQNRDKAKTYYQQNKVTILKRKKEKYDTF